MAIQANFTMNGTYPFINLYRRADTAPTVNGPATERFQACYDRDQYLTRMPAGATSITRSVPMPPLAGMQNFNPTENGRMVLRWDGDPTGNTFGGYNAATADTSIPNRIEFDYPGTTFSFQQKTIHSNYAKNIVVMRKSHEALYDAGETINPDFDVVGHGFTTWRFLDAMTINGNFSVLPSHMLSRTVAFWCTNYWYAGWWFGTSNDVDDYVFPTAPPGWTTDDPVQFRMANIPTRNTIANVIAGNPTRVSFVNPLAASWVAGKKLHFATVTGTWSLVTGNAFGTMSNLIHTIQNVIDANTIDIAFDSTPTPAQGTATYTGTGQIVIYGATITVPGLAQKLITNGTKRVLTTQLNAVNDYSFQYDSVLDLYLAPTQLGHRPGIPPEWAIDVCAKTQSACWMHYPCIANDAYLQAFIQRCHDYAVPKNVLCKFEYVNEVWNTAAGYPTTNLTIARAQQKWGASVAGPEANYYGRRAAMFAKFCRDIYTDRPELFEVLIMSNVKDSNTGWHWRLDAPAWKSADPAEFAFYCPGTNPNGSAKRPGDLIHGMGGACYLSGHYYTTNIGADLVLQWSDAVAAGNAALADEAIVVGLEDYAHGTIRGSRPTKPGTVTLGNIGNECVDDFILPAAPSVAGYGPRMNALAVTYGLGTNPSGLKVYAYEGADGWAVEGQGHTGSDGRVLPSDNVLIHAYQQAVKSDPRMFDVYLRFFESWDGDGTGTYPRLNSNTHEPSIYVFCDGLQLGQYFTTNTGFYTTTAPIHLTTDPTVSGIYSLNGPRWPPIAAAIDNMRGIAIIPPPPPPPPTDVPPVGGGHGSRGHKKHLVQRSRMGVIAA